MKTLVEEFLEAEKPRVSAQGFKSINALARQMMRWFDREDVDPLETGIVEALRYQKDLSERTTAQGQKLGIGTMLNHLKAARRFFDYLVMTERIKSNPFLELKHPRQAMHMSQNVLTEAQMGRLLGELGKFDELPFVRSCHRRYRVHVLAEFLYATGLRIAEACGLMESSLDLEHRLVYVAAGKGGRPRTAFLTGYASQVLDQYVRKGRSAVMRNGQNDESLFGARKDTLVILANKEIREVCQALELPVITTHGFRHSLGTHLLRSGCDMRHIQVILGHQALSTTQIYTRVDKEDLKRSLDEFHPRKWNPRFLDEQ